MVDQPNPQYDESEAPLPRELRKVVEQIAQQTPSDELVRCMLAKSRTTLSATTAQGLAASRPTSPVRRQWLLWVSLAMAASLGAAALGWWFHTGRTAASSIAREPQPIQSSPDSATVSTDDSGKNLPTVWACNRALRESPEALEAFLDRVALPSVGKPLVARHRASAALTDQML